VRPFREWLHPGEIRGWNESLIRGMMLQEKNHHYFTCGQQWVIIENLGMHNGAGRFFSRGSVIIV